MNKIQNKPFFHFNTNDVKIPERAKILWDILVNKIVQHNQTMTPQLYLDSVIEWDKLRFSAVKKHLQDLTIAGGMHETTESLMLLGYSREQIGSKKLHKFFLTEFKRWLRIDRIQGDAKLTPKLFPIIEPVVLNWTITLVNEISIQWSDPLKLPISIVPKPINVAAALVLLQFFSFLRAKELYYTSFSQAERCITVKTLKIQLNGKKHEVPTLVTYTNVRFHKTDYKGKFKTCAFVIATAEKKQNKKGRGKWNLTLMGHALAILQAKGRQVVNKNIEWDSLVHPMKIGNTFRPLTRTQINESLKQLEITAGVKKAATSYTLRRSSFAMLALHQVPREQIRKCATWSDDKLLEIYCGENPLGAAGKLRKINHQITFELMLHAAAKDAYKHIEPTNPKISPEFLNNEPLNDYESDQDSDIDEQNFRDNIAKFRNRK